MTRPEPITLAAPDGPLLSALWWSAPAERPAVVIIPGLDSRKENHRDQADAIAARGMGALALDLRGHGESGGRLDEGCLDDVRAAIDLLADWGHVRIGLRGSSMGGLIALCTAAEDRRIGAVAAICAARPGPLADRIGADWPRRLDPLAAVQRRPGDLARGFWHARGDERVPWTHTMALAAQTSHPMRLRIAMGGNHGSLQHRPATVAAVSDFLRRHL